MKSIIKPYTQPAFLICIAVLAIAGTGKKTAIQWSGAHLKKLSLPLKKPLDLLDDSALMPYRVIRKHKITNKDMLEQLGTQEYVQWELEDTQAHKFSPVKYCSLFITYYTGHLDQVPHVPEECYTGGGNQQLGSESVTLNVQGLHTSKIVNDDGKTVQTEQTSKINARYIVFIRQGSNMWQATSKYSVLYLFQVNGTYAGSRSETRAIMGKNLFGKYSYFSKVEWKFYGGGMGGVTFPNKQEAIKASEKLLSVLLPVMAQDHWPDWAKASSER